MPTVEVGSCIETRLSCNTAFPNSQNQRPVGSGHRFNRARTISFSLGNVVDNQVTATAKARSATALDRLAALRRRNNVTLKERYKRDSEGLEQR